MKVLLAVLLMSLIAATSATDFNVGWSQSPSESYSQWAQRRRFLVHDKLVFKYKKGEDSVLVVKKEDYDSCSTSSPIKKMDGGDSVFDIDRAGPFYFISGVGGKCAKGQKLAVVVLAERNNKPTPTTPTSPSSSPSPSVNPPITSPSSAPSPSTMPPITGPSPAPTPSTEPPITGPSPAPTPSTEPPATSPSPSPYSPTTPPSLSPSNSVPPGSQVISPAPSPTSGKDNNSASAVAASSLALGLLLVLLCAAMA